MKKIVYVIIMLCCAVFCSAQIYEPVKWHITENGNCITLKATIDDGWHVYGTDIPQDGPRATNVVFETLKNVDLKGRFTAAQQPESHYDENFEMQLTWFAKEVIFEQKFTPKSDDWAISGYVEYMCCNDEQCLPPTQVKFEFANKPAKIETSSTIEPLVVNEEKENIYTPVIDELRAFNNETTEEKESLWKIFLLGLLGGIIALFTPCVWPIIPMTVSFFLKHSDNAHKGKRDAVIYGLSIVVIYVVLGLLITLIFGASALNSLATNAVFNLFFFALLVVFALSFFGMFELALPASWSTRIDKKASTTTGMLSILLMAFTLVIVSFSCTGPIIGTLLVEVSTQNSILAPTIGMLGFAIALALPFALFALFPTWLKSLPKSGGWLNSVKVVLGFLELAFALKFFSVADLAYGWHLLDREVFVALWIVIFALLGFYLLGKITLPHDEKLERISVTRLMLGLVSLAFAVYMIPGLWGAPLKSISAFAPPLYTQDFNIYQNQVEADFDDYEAGLNYAKQHNKPAIIDFSGYGCVNCRKMEAAVWTDTKVADLLNNDFVLITLYVDDKTPLVEPFSIEENGQTREIKTIGDKNSYLQRTKFGANAQPFYVVLNNEGKPLNGPYAFDENAQHFADFLIKSLENDKK